jgi:hypothetical protein
VSAQDPANQRLPGASMLLPWLRKRKAQGAADSNEQHLKRSLHSLEIAITGNSRVQKPRVWYNFREQKCEMQSQIFVRISGHKVMRLQPRYTIRPLQVQITVGALEVPITISFSPARRFRDQKQFKGKPLQTQGLIAKVPYKTSKLQRLGATLGSHCANSVAL